MANCIWSYSSGDSLAEPSTATLLSQSLHISLLPSTLRFHLKAQGHYGYLRHSVSILYHPRLEKRSKRNWHLEKQSLLYINIVPNLESEMDFLILTTFTYHFLLKDSLSSCEQDKGCFTNQRLMAISFCIFSGRESSLTSYPKMFEIETVVWKGRSWRSFAELSVIFQDFSIVHDSWIL